MTWEPSAIAEALARLQHTQRLAGVFMPSGVAAQLHGGVACP